ncbi:MAG: hypothetical protein MUE56_10540 [Ignavibacteria bacterium]|jgi:hypothetical protein|nr:hypothetical protein [Ignavibacteria bacterium]
MIKKIMLISIIITAFAYTRSYADTTFTCMLDFDSILDKVTINVDEYEQSIKVTVDEGGKKSKRVFVPATVNDVTAKYMMIGQNVYLMVTNADYYGYEGHFFRFFDNKLDSIGHVFSLEEINLGDNGKINAKHWMGFWSADVDYEISGNRILKRHKKEYDISKNFTENEIRTTAIIHLHSNKHVNAKGLYEIKTGTRVYLLKADITKDCNDENFIEGCHWYFIKAENGTSGWIMLKEFMDKVEGIPWAG